jgi:hypothetical protein
MLAMPVQMDIPCMLRSWKMTRTQIARAVGGKLSTTTISRPAAPGRQPPSGLAARMVARSL